jgi:hypothetical protein
MLHLPQALLQFLPGPSTTSQRATYSSTNNDDVSMQQEVTVMDKITAAATSNTDGPSFQIENTAGVVGDPLSAVPSSTDQATISSSSYALYLSSFVASIATEVILTSDVSVAVREIGIWSVGPAGIPPNTTTIGDSR